MRVLGLGMVLLVAGGAFGQQKPVVPAVPPPTGTVVGHVMFADTQRPAKFAAVAVLRVPEAAESGAGAATAKLPERVMMLDGRTGPDGSFRIAAIPPGDYYVVATVPGYIFPVARVMTEKEAEDPAKLLAGVPLVHVQADKTAEAEVSLRRGGVVAGRVTFDDGTPVAGAFVNVAPVEGLDGLDANGFKFQALSQIRNQNGQANGTNDDGYFRLAGLQPGKYRVNVSVQVGAGQRMISMAGGGYTIGGAQKATPLLVYMPGTVRKSEAKEVEVTAGQSAQADIEVKLSGMHSARGVVLVREDRHAPNRARVVVRDDGDKDFSRSASLDPDGHWQVDYLPAGSYTATVSGAEDVDDPYAMGFNVKAVTLRKYAKATEPVVIGEHDAVVEELLLDEAKAGAVKK